jgi:hypothetical protein
VRLEWLVPRGALRRTARLDTGAPFSILPYTFWNNNQLPWQELGHQLLTNAGLPLPHALDWQGVPSLLGVVQVRLVDEANNLSRVLRVIAKFPTTRLPAFAERAVLLGYNFLEDNALILNLNPRNRRNVGNVNNVVGFLTVP